MSTNVEGQFVSPNDAKPRVSGSAGNSIEDLLFLFGIGGTETIISLKGRKHNRVQPKKRFYMSDPIKIIAENDWLDGKDAKDNPYKVNSWQYNVWYSTWLDYNKNC